MIACQSSPPKHKHASIRGVCVREDLVGRGASQLARSAVQVLHDDCSFVHFADVGSHPVVDGAGVGRKMPALEP